MTADDLDAVEQIAGIVHPGLFERREVLAEKQRLYPEGTWLCERANQACGYLLSHPWRARDIPALDTLLETIPGDATTYYLHDLALLPEARGSGAAGAAVRHAVAHAADTGFATASLVAVNGSLPFWERWGFSPHDLPHLSAKLAAYDPGARYMIRVLV